ncbi:MAG: DUF501 domain-containing protein [Phycisphaeraceae bacterium]
MSLPSHDLLALTQQLGRRPRDVVAVAVGCPAGHPCVVLNYPLRHRGGQAAIFPTLYWLTCPNLSRQIDSIEQGGAIRQIEQELRLRPDLLRRLHGEHRASIARRWRLLSAADRQTVRHDPAWRRQLLSRGIGGLRDWTTVKCLHLHVAHHLAMSNAIGEWVMQRYGLHLCR